LKLDDAQIDIYTFLLAASLVALITILVYKDSILKDSFDRPNHVDYCWRILIGLGCVPGAIALYFRLTIPETPRFTMDIERDIQAAKNDIYDVLGDGSTNVGIYWVGQRVEAPRRSRRDFIRYFGQSKNLQLLFGAAYSWFAIDASLHWFICGIAIGIG
jgi:MFS transporter, PHS family, inorganic phosphate transporter